MTAGRHPRLPRPRISEWLNRDGEPRIRAGHRTLIALCALAVLTGAAVPQPAPGQGSATPQAAVTAPVTEPAVLTTPMVAPSTFLTSSPASTTALTATHVQIPLAPPSSPVSFADTRAALNAAQKQAKSPARIIAARKAAAAKRVEAKRAADAIQRAADAGIDVTPAQAKAAARQLVTARGWDDKQFTCLDSLWTRESDWLVNAENLSSKSYGIPQSLPATKMASEGDDWKTNSVTQIKWGLGYIAGRYDTPCNAWAHSENTNPHWY